MVNDERSNPNLGESGVKICNNEIKLDPHFKKRIPTCRMNGKREM